MRFVVVGAGAVGGVISARLHQHGYDVAAVARGAHHDAIRARGLHFVAPEEDVWLTFPVHSTPGAAKITDDDVVLVCVKSQDTVSALDAISEVAPPEVPVVCVQNGVANEREALRRFRNVYGVCVVLPSTFLTPGEVEAHAAPVTGILDIGRAFDTNIDDAARAISSAFSSSTFMSETLADVMRWKYRKLLNNLTNAIDALIGRDQRIDGLDARVRAEGDAVLAAAGIGVATADEDAERRGDALPWRGPAAGTRAGSSSWQSLARGSGAIEADYLNGEIVLLGRLHGVPTPVNAALQRLANDAARRGLAPASTPVDEVIRAVDRSE